jgi:hypothetical protein
MPYRSRQAIFVVAPVVGASGSISHRMASLESTETIFALLEPHPLPREATIRPSQRIIVSF